MHRAFNTNEKILIEKVNHKAIIYDTSKYSHFTDAIIADDFFQKLLNQVIIMTISL